MKNKLSPTVRIFADIPAYIHRALTTIAAETGEGRGDVYAAALVYAAVYPAVFGETFAANVKQYIGMARTQEPTP